MSPEDATAKALVKHKLLAAAVSRQRESPEDTVARIVEKMPVHSSGQSLSPRQRGIILPSPTEVISVHNLGDPRQYRQTILSLRPEPLDLRQAALFWDAIHCPEEVTPLYQDDADIAFLAECGIIRHYDGPSQDDLASALNIEPAYIMQQGAYAIYSQLRMNLFSKLERDEPNQWAMARGISSPDFLPKEVVKGRGALVTLTNMLPVPTGEVNLNDVLEFKEKRRDELASLQDHLGVIHGRISEQGIDGLAADSHLRQFERSVSDLQSAMRSSGLVSVLMDLASGINVAGLATTTITAAVDPKHIIPVAGLAIAGTLTVEPFKALAKRKTEKAFEYVAQYHTELTWYDT